eukprot:4616213-Amphidinium_carterae.1
MHQSNDASVRLVPRALRQKGSRPNSSSGSCHAKNKVVPGHRDIAAKQLQQKLTYKYVQDLSIRI